MKSLFKKIKNNSTMYIQQIYINKILDQKLGIDSKKL